MLRHLKIWGLALLFSAALPALGAFTVPALTAVHLSIERLAVDIADALAPGSTRTTIETDATLVLRDSCGCRSSMEGDRP